MLWKFPASISATEELQSCSIILQTKSLKEYNIELLHGAIFYKKKEILDILCSSQMKAK